MASPSTTSILNKICNSVEKIANVVTKGGAKGGGSAAGRVGAAGILKGGINAAQMKSVANSIKDIVSGISKVSGSAKSGEKFNKFMGDLSSIIATFNEKDKRAGIEQFERITKSFERIKPLKLMALSVAFMVVSPALALFGFALRAFPEKQSEGAARALDKVGKAFKGIGAGIALITLSFVVSSLALASVGVKGGVIGLIASLGGVLLFALLLDKLKATRALRHIGKGFVGLAGGIALLSLSIVVSSLALQKVSGGAFAMGILSVMISLGGVLLSMVVLSKIGAVRAMRNVGRGMMGIAAGIALLTLTFILSGLAFSKIIKSFNAPSPVAEIVGGILGGLAPIVLLWGISKIVASYGSKKVRTGGNAMIATGIGLAAIGIGMLILCGAFYLTMKMAMSKDAPVVELGGVNWGPALVFLGPIGWLLGIGLISRFIYGNTKTLTGGVAMVAVGAGLIALGIGTLIFSFALKDVEPEKMIAMGAFITGLGVIAAAAGAAAALILPGAVAIGAIGGALILFGAGVFVLSKALPEDTETFADSFAAIVSGLYNGIGLKEAGFFIPAAAGLAAMGLALIPFSIGVGAMSLVVASSFGQTFKDTIISITEALDGFEIPFSAMLAFTMIGPALASLAYGLSSWMNLENVPLVDHYDKNGKPVYGSEKADIKKAIANIRDFLDPNADVNIIGAFTKFANDNKELLKSQGVLGLSPSPLLNGINGVRMIGLALSGLAMGVSTWMNLQNMKVIDHYDKNGKPVYGKESLSVQTAIDHIREFLRPGSGVSIIDMFAEFANRNKDLFEEPGLFRKSSSVFVKGVGGIQIIGNALTSLGQGIATWMNLDNIKVIDHYDKDGKPVYGKEKLSIKGAIDNIKKFLEPTGEYSLIGAFKAFGESYNDDDTEAVEEMCDVIAKLSTSLAGSGDPEKPAAFDRALTNFDKLNNSFTKFNENMELIKSTVSVFRDINKEFKNMTMSLINVPESKWKILVDLTKALKEFSEGDHTDNLLKSAIALQAALTHDTADNSGNAKVEEAKAQVEKTGLNMGKDMNPTNANAAAESKNPLLDAIASLKMSIDEMSGKLDGLRVYVTNNPLENN